MKKVIGIALMLLMLFAATACIDGDNATVDTTAIHAQVQADNVEEGTSDTEANSQENSATVPEWKKFLEEYEKLVDDYIIMLKKYKDNPTDMSVLADYTKMVSDLASWTKRADDIQSSIQDTEDALEYSKEMLRIAQKLAEVGQ